MSGQPDRGDRRDTDFPTFAMAVRRLMGVDLLQYRREQTERRLRALARRRGTETLFDYLLLLRRDPGEQAILRDHVTINVSRLWRNPEHWQLLERVALAPAAAAGRGLRAWSAGCSYGAEPYTLAMLWRGLDTRASIRIDATDIDQASIERARLGRFSDDDVREMPTEVRDRWLERHGTEWLARAELRRSIDFRVADIFEPVEPERYDLVLCRNVVIYHTTERRDEIHRLLARSIRPGGWLMVGATERVTQPQRLGLVAEHPFLYRRIDQRSPDA